MDTNNIDTQRALVRRELIREANVRGMRADELDELLKWSDKTYDVQILTHPSFPGGVFAAWRAHHG